METKKVPLGRPLPLDSSDIENASQITDEDIERVKEFWRSSAPFEFYDLLDALPTNEGE